MERKTINLAVFIVLLLIGIALFSLWQDGVVRERRLQAEGVFNESDESISSAQRSLKSIKGRRRNMTLAGNYSLHHLYNRIISHKRIRNTTSSSLPSLIKTYLFNHGERITDSSVKAAVESLNTFTETLHVPYNNITDSLTTLLSEGNNHPEIKLQTDPTITSEGYKYYEEKKNKEFLQYDENHLKELFDIIVITGPQETDLTYLNDWKPLIENIHVIIIQQGHPNRQINVPDWLEFELYNKKDIDRSFT
eukprot:gene14746-16370_t